MAYLITEKKFQKLTELYLLSQKGVTPGKVKKHLTPEYNKPNSLNKIFQRMCQSAQNYQMATNVIGGSLGEVKNLSVILYNFDPHKTAKNYKISDWNKLFNNIKKRLKPTGKLRTTKLSIWPKYCKAVLRAAHFLSKFESPKYFYEWTKQYDGDIDSIVELPMIISKTEKVFGFALACDFLKEIGFTQYGKPDVHIKKILSSLKFYKESSGSTQNDILCLKAIINIAQKSKKTAFEIDKMLWLISSGKFYRNDQKIEKKREEFIKYIKDYGKTNSSLHLINHSI